MALEAAQAFAATNLKRPNMVKMMTESHVVRGFWLGGVHALLPHLPQAKTQVAFEYQAQHWPVVVIPDKMGFSGGWRQVAIDNALVPGDVVVFEVLPPKTGDPSGQAVVKLFFFRAKDCAAGGASPADPLLYPDAPQLDMRGRAGISMVERSSKGAAGSSKKGGAAAAAAAGPGAEGVPEGGGADDGAGQQQITEKKKKKRKGKQQLEAGGTTGGEGQQGREERQEQPQKKIKLKFKRPASAAAASGSVGDAAATAGTGTIDLCNTDTCAEPAEAGSAGDDAGDEAVSPRAGAGEVGPSGHGPRGLPPRAGRPVAGSLGFDVGRGVFNEAATGQSSGQHGPQQQMQAQKKHKKARSAADEAGPSGSKGPEDGAGSKAAVKAAGKAALKPSSSKAAKPGASNKGAAKGSVKAKGGPVKAKGAAKAKGKKGAATGIRGSLEDLLEGEAEWEQQQENQPPSSGHFPLAIKADAKSKTFFNIPPGLVFKGHKGGAWLWDDAQGGYVPIVLEDVNSGKLLEKVDW